MTNDWNNFIQSRMKAERMAYEQTLEAQHRRKIQAHIDQLLATNLSQTQRKLVGEALATLGEMEAEDGKRLYLQGMMDGVKILGQLMCCGA